MNKKKEEIPFINRELSWLDFNERVLQEADDESVPLLERIRFLGIFSSNLDEFYQVRVASTNRLASSLAEVPQDFDIDPKDLIKKINQRTKELQHRFESIFEKLIKELENQQITIVDENSLLPEHHKFVIEYFDEKVRPTIVPIMLNENIDLRLNGDSIYFAIKILGLKNKVDYAIMEIPSMVIPRFLVLPTIKEQRYVVLLDDIIRFRLDDLFTIFKYKKIEAYTIKATLDSELDIDDDISESNIDILIKSLKKRKTAQPVRFIYDKNIPVDLLEFILNKIDGSALENDSIIAAGKYHNFKDFINFPNVGAKKLSYKKLEALQHPQLKNKSSIINEISKNDILLAFPYQSFNHIIDLLREAAIDPKVQSIKINLYRVAKNSKIIHALISAAKNGKKVTVVIELRARFDEEANIYWAKKLKDAGVKVIFGIPGLKVHAKLILIVRKEKNENVKYAHIGTCNFHEGNANVYVDVSLLTKNSLITNEVGKVFRLFKNTYERPSFKHLIVSPFNTRRKLGALIDNEIQFAKQDKSAYIILKLNNLVDPQIIKKLYQASNAGVQIKLIIRGICSLVPGVKSFSENIAVISIVDRFLEHSRLYVFGNNGDELYYLSSADFMGRNFDNRIEVGTPIYDENAKKILKDLLNIMWTDNVKVRLLNTANNNAYVANKSKKNRSQIELHKYFKKMLTNENQIK